MVFCFWFYQIVLSIKAVVIWNYRFTVKIISHRLLWLVFHQVCVFHIQILCWISPHHLFISLFIICRYLNVNIPRRWIERNGWLNSVNGRWNLFFLFFFFKSSIRIIERRKYTESDLHICVWWIALLLYSFFLHKRKSIRFQRSKNRRIRKIGTNKKQHSFG